MNIFDTRDEVITLPYTSKEHNHESRTRLARNVYQSWYYMEFSTLTIEDLLFYYDDCIIVTIGSNEEGEDSALQENGDDDSSSNESDDDDLKAQENLALSLIRKNT